MKERENNFINSSDAVIDFCRYVGVSDCGMVYSTPLHSLNKGVGHRHQHIHVYSSKWDTHNDTGIIFVVKL